MTLANSTRIPSPTTLMILPRCSLIVGSIRLLQCAFHWARDPSSSAPTSRLYPATSAAKMVTSCRFTPSLAKTSSEVPRGPSYRITEIRTLSEGVGIRDPSERGYVGRLGLVHLNVIHRSCARA